MSPLVFGMFLQQIPIECLAKQLLKFYPWREIHLFFTVPLGWQVSFMNAQLPSKLKTVIISLLSFFGMRPPGIFSPLAAVGQAGDSAPAQAERKEPVEEE